MSQLQLPHECVKKEQWRMRVLMSGVIDAMMPYCFWKTLTQNNLTYGNRMATLQGILFDINISNSYYVRIFWSKSFQNLKDSWKLL